MPGAEISFVQHLIEHPASGRAAQWASFHASSPRIEKGNPA
jgi:hypothetical protein